MPASSYQRWKRLIVAAWVINIVCLVGIAGFWLVTRTPVGAFFVSPTPSATITPSSTSTYTPTATASITSTPTITAAPTDTPTPTVTPTITPTTIPFSEGPIVIGYSVQKRPLEVYRFGTGPTEKLIVAGMHGGNEYNTVELADQLVAYIQANPGVIPADVTLFIFHDLNPDGVAKEHGPNGRANAHGVDLNRNWPANWQKDWPRAGCWIDPPVTGGTGPASEPETTALMAFIKAHHFQAIINYHSAALGIFPGGIPIAANSKLLAQAIAAVTKYPYPPVNTGCDYTGGFVDWTSNNGIASLDVELTNHTDTDFDQNLLALNVFLNWKQ
jgi:predicted deacylase